MNFKNGSDIYNYFYDKANGYPNDYSSLYNLAQLNIKTRVVI
jgi:hypothetical protein